MIPFSAELETNLLSMSPNEVQNFCEENKTKSQITKIINTAYNIINLIHYFTAGPDEVKC